MDFVIYVSKQRQHHNYCFKLHGSVQEGRQMLEDARAGVDAVMAGMEESDPEEDDENRYLSDMSIDIGV
uniref:Uncharacterized protein n=1 Tax=Ditylenchus dipsaci TaxID=166011 RepID=A0A915DR38_9BILA